MDLKKGRIMRTVRLTSRRRFLCLTGSVAAGILPAIAPTGLAAQKKEGKESAVSPVEDLMREHGVLRRMLLIYEEAAYRIEKNKDLPPAVLEESAGIMRRFVENYHEKLEENEIFPRFEKAGKLGDLVKVLFGQHQAGRSITDSILKLSEPKALEVAKPKKDESAAVDQIYGGTPLLQWLHKGGSSSAKLGRLPVAIRQFVRMYRPHAAWEDTVLFPAVRSIITPAEFDELGEKFEQREQELLGRNGFEKTLESVEDLEKKLGIHDLSKYTREV
jgi:hemerythrin-like domain-containing protein